jgi:hypothetical protein
MRLAAPLRHLAQHVDRPRDVHVSDSGSIHDTHEPRRDRKGKQFALSLEQDVGLLEAATFSSLTQ